MDGTTGGKYPQDDCSCSHAVRDEDIANDWVSRAKTGRDIDKDV